MEVSNGLFRLVRSAGGDEVNLGSNAAQEVCLWRVAKKLGWKPTAVELRAGRMLQSNGV